MTPRPSINIAKPSRWSRCRRYSGEGAIVSNENHMGDESVGNPGQTVDSEEELNQPTAVGSPEAGE